MAKEVTIARESKVSLLNIEGLPPRYIPSRDYIQAIQQKWGGRLIIHPKSDGEEIIDNVRAAEAMLRSFPDMRIKIREYIIIENLKNPEYEVNGLIGDRKGIHTENGVTSGFRKAKKQHCDVVVVDMDKHMGRKQLDVDAMSRHIRFRHADFESGIIKQCYVVYHDKAVCIERSHFEHDSIDKELEKLKR